MISDTEFSMISELDSITATTFLGERSFSINIDTRLIMNSS